MHVPAERSLGSARVGRETALAIPVCLAVALAAGADLYTRARTANGAAFWHARAVAIAVAGGVSNPYSRTGRERVYALVAAPQTRSADARERAAAVQSADLDTRVLSYRGLDVLQTPLLLSFFRLFAAGAYERDYRAFLALSLLSLFLASYALARMVGHPRSIALLVAAVVGLALEGEASELRVANVNDVELGLVALFLWLQWRAGRWSDVAGGAVLAVAVAFKPNAAPVAAALALAWAGGREWRKIGRVAAGAAVGALVSVAVSALLVGPRAWVDWVEVIPEMMRSAHPTSYGNMSLSMVVGELSGLDVSPLLLATGLFTLAVVSLRPLYRPGPSGSPFRRTFCAAGAGLLLPLVAARLVWLHYTVLALPALLAATRWAWGRVPAWAAAVAVFLLSTGGFQLVALAAGMGRPQVVACDLALLLLFALSAGLLWRLGAAGDGDGLTPAAPGALS